MVKFDFNKTPITQIADYIILAAAKSNASDIHFDPREDGMIVRIRVDGDLQNYTHIPKAYERNLSTRLKLLANMNITESRLPQDGAIKGNFGGTYLDMRVSCLPLNEGEKIVIRILDYSRSLEGLESLGFSEKNLKKLKRMIKVPNGIILITGATGSGKSTTVYSILDTLNKEETNIITVEDPIEMNIEGLNQVQVNSEIGMTFAAALRSILRQDPNIILVGEIRDSETAQIAVRASITGHLVLSTVHTNNALTGIISQRLAKKTCQKCHIERETTEYEKKLLKVYLNMDVDKVYDANKEGCDHCHNGYKGRTAIQEVLELDDEIRFALNNDDLKKQDIKNMIYTENVITMLQDALEKVVLGVTTFDEVYRVIEVDDVNSLFESSDKLVANKNSANNNNSTKPNTKIEVPTFAKKTTMATPEVKVQPSSTTQLPQVAPVTAKYTSITSNVPVSPTTNNKPEQQITTQPQGQITPAIPASVTTKYTTIAPNIVTSNNLQQPQVAPQVKATVQTTPIKSVVPTTPQQIIQPTAVPTNNPNAITPTPNNTNLPLNPTTQNINNPN